MGLLTFADTVEADLAVLTEFEGLMRANITAADLRSWKSRHGFIGRNGRPFRMVGLAAEYEDED